MYKLDCKYCRYRVAIVFYQGRWGRVGVYSCELCMPRGEGHEIWLREGVEGQEDKLGACNISCQAT